MRGRCVRKLEFRAGVEEGDDRWPRDDDQCHGGASMPPPRPLSRRERGEERRGNPQAEPAPLPPGEGPRGEADTPPPWQWSSRSRGRLSTILLASSTSISGHLRSASSISLIGKLWEFFYPPSPALPPSGTSGPAPSPPPAPLEPAVPEEPPKAELPPLPVLPPFPTELPPAPPLAPPVPPQIGRASCR